jgi:arylformamidase
MGERLLFKTHNSTRCWDTNKFVKDFVYVSTEAAEFLADRRVGLVGIDYLSVGGFRAGNGVAVHRTLLGREVYILEGLNLSAVQAGRYFLICLPLRILNGDGAPARALLKPLR